jgi:hypothetical protein
MFILLKEVYSSTNSCLRYVLYIYWCAVVASYLFIYAFEVSSALKEAYQESVGTPKRRVRNRRR